MHNVFIAVLDETGQPLCDPIGRAGWTWEDKRPDERADPVPLDKPLAEMAGNIDVFKDQKVSVWLNGLSRDAVDKSDRVENLHTMHPHEPEPTGELWNSVGHHSFYVVFQRTLKEGVISGQIEHGRGYTMHLLRGNTVIAEQKVSDTLTYKFEGLPSGAYRVQAVGPTLDCDAVQLDTNHAQATVNLTAPQS